MRDVHNDILDPKMHAQNTETEIADNVGTTCDVSSPAHSNHFFMNLFYSKFIILRGVTASTALACVRGVSPSN